MIHGPGHIKLESFILGDENFAIALSTITIFLFRHEKKSTQFVNSRAQFEDVAIAILRISYSGRPLRSIVEANAIRLNSTVDVDVGAFDQTE